MLKILILCLIPVDFIYEAALYLLNRSRRALPLPENVRDVYDAQSYARRMAYSDEHSRLALIEAGLDCALLEIVFLFDVPAMLSSLLPQNVYLNPILLMLTAAVASTVIGLPFAYISEMKIEKKYGFGKSTTGTFAADQVKGLIISIAVDCGLTALSVLFYRLWGAAFILAVAAAVVIVVFVISTFSLTFQKLFNKFTPLPDGELRDRLTALFGSAGYKLKNIWVMDASKRTAKVNAFCAGLGRFKEIALYDTLQNDYTTDEITAIFAHELTHFRRRDTLKLTVSNLLTMLPAALFAYALVRYPAAMEPLGFYTVNLAAVYYVIAQALYEPFNILLSIPSCAFSRHCEYNADRGAVRAGYGDALSEALKKITRANFANLDPHPAVVTLTYSHPTLSQRLDAIKAAAADMKKSSSGGKDR